MDHTEIILKQQGILVVNHHHEKNASIAEHYHNYPTLLYVTSGEGLCLLGESSYPIKTDTAILIPPKQTHAIQDFSGHPMVVWSIAFDEKVLDSALRIHQTKVYHLPVYPSKQIHTSLRDLLYEQNKKAPFYTDAMRCSLARIFIILSRLNPSKANQDVKRDSLSKVKDVLDAIHVHYHEKNTLSDAAKLSHLSQRQFSNLCKQITGKNYISWINEIRCLKAKGLLLGTELPISAIAFEVGFEELSTFYRAFKNVSQLTPKQIRLKEKQNT